MEMRERKKKKERCGDPSRRNAAFYLSRFRVLLCVCVCVCVRSFFCVPLPPIRIHKNKEKHFLLVIIRDGVGRLITKKRDRNKEPWVDSENFRFKNKKICAETFREPPF